VWQSRTIVAALPQRREASAAHPVATRGGSAVASWWAVHRKTRIERLSTFVAAALVVALLAGIDEAQVECEEAVAHVLDCCPGVSPQDICGAGCGEVGISHDQSECLRGKECDELRAGGVCDRFTRLMIPDAGAPEGGPVLCE
jgi:hypothetical protein